MILNLIVSFLVALLMGMGVGGGGLFVIYLTLCLNFNQQLAQGTNLVFFILAVLASIFVHFKKRKIYKNQIALMVIFGLVGSLLFSHIANSVSPEIPKKVLGGLLIVSGTIILLKAFYKKDKNIFKKTLYK